MSTTDSIAPAEDSTDRIPKEVDVVVVGAGISGIGAARYLKTMLPGKTFAVLEARDALGGTWDLFRYPGLRSDSDLQTFAYAFKPWTSKNAIADAGEILAYLRETVSENELGPHIHYGHKVLGAEWSSAEARWTVRVKRAEDGELLTVRSRFLFGATGYYDYDAGFRPDFEGEEDFAGEIVHPQAWPEDLDYTGKRVVVIGSGSTAVTLIPAMAERAEHVTMLQRSPTYILPLPGKDPLAIALQRILGAERGYRITRRINIGRQKLIWDLSKRYPKQVRRVIRAVNKLLLPRGYDVDRHFNPRYNPWDERLCAARDGDLFRAIRQGRASVATDHIERFTERGILLRSGEELAADVIVTATGLNLLAIGGMELTVDGRGVEIADEVVYKSMMLSGVPNFAIAVGYVNASWTLKVDLVCEHFCRLIAHMDEHGYDAVVPVADDRALERRPLLDFSAGYVQRAVERFPKQGSTDPWNIEMSYASDRKRLRHGPVEDPALEFRAADPERRPEPLAA
jgi:cation diffusion facilitator CzcD-associated flavoprotein CzcO